jgi:hypothetical protein
MALEIQFFAVKWPGAEASESNAGMNRSNPDGVKTSSTMESMPNAAKGRAALFSPF